MKTFVITLFFGLSMLQLCPAQPVHNSVSLDIMTTAVSRSTMDSVPLKVSVRDYMRLSELMIPVTDEESGEIFITGTPYDSIQVQVPGDISVTNQHGEHAELQDFQFKYGTSEVVSVMEVVSPAGCVAIQIPESGRIHVRLGGRLVSDDKLRGIYTSSIRLDCKREE